MGTKKNVYLAISAYMGGRIMVPQTCHALITRTCEYLAKGLCKCDLDMERLSWII